MFYNEEFSAKKRQSQEMHAANECQYVCSHHSKDQDSLAQQIHTFSQELCDAIQDWKKKRTVSYFFLLYESLEGSSDSTTGWSHGGLYTDAKELCQRHLSTEGWRQTGSVCLLVFFFFS